MLAARPASIVRQKDMSAAWRHVDFVMVAVVAMTSMFGVAMVYSATRTGTDPWAFAEKHIVFAVIGSVAASAAGVIDYSKYAQWSRLLYLGGILGLIGVAIPGIGALHNGIRAWYEVGPIQIQPAEMAKLTVTVAVASYLGNQTEGVGLRHTLTVLAMFALPIGLIMLQPDLGTALVFVVMCAAMLLVSGVPVRYLVVLGLLGVGAVTTILTSDTLDEYQKARLTTFVNPDDKSDAALKASYNTRQAQAAISLGGLTGKGYLKGEFTSGGSVPEQQTDFIFTVPGEELGFAGSALLLTLLGAIVWRAWRAAVLARDEVGTLICVGVIAMFMFHVFENAGMALGIMPVTGIPLPLVSYGGSSTLTAFVAIGLVLNVHMRRFT